MKRVKLLGFLAASSGLVVLAGCKKESKQTVAHSASAVVQAAAPPSLSEYRPVGEGNAFFNVVNSELNYHGSGQQAALLEIVYNTFDERAGSPTGHFLVLYNPKVEDRAGSSNKLGCDLGRMLFDDSGQPWKQISYYAHGEGLMGGDIGLENEKYVGRFSLDGCRFVLIGVRSDGVHIPEEAWSKAAQFASKRPSSGPLSNPSSAPIGENEGRTPLWDARRPGPWYERPELPAEDASRISSLVKQYTGSPEDVWTFSSVKGRFLRGSADEQTLVSVSQSDNRRSMAQGPWSFIAVYSKGKMKLLKTEMDGTLLKTVHVPDADVDYVLLDSSGGEQGESRDYFRLVSVDGFRFRIIHEIGIVRESDCAGFKPKGVVADSLYVQFQTSAQDFSIRRQHYFSRCLEDMRDITPASFTLLNSSGGDAESVFNSLPEN